MQPIKNLSFWALAFGLIFSALGCQQTHIEFTPKAEAQLPVFDKLKGAPKITPLNDKAPRHSEPISVTPKLALYLFDDTLSGLNHLSLVAYSSLPMANLDVLVQAFEEKRTWLVLQSTLACAESLSIRPSMHSLTISIDCPDSPALASELLMQLWQADSFDELDIANVRRQLKLAKHINAYSGAEIDDVWAKKILGEQHIYNQALNDKTLADELDLAKLNRIRDTILAQADWAFFANNSLELSANNSLEQEFSAALADQFKLMTRPPADFEKAAATISAASETTDMEQAKPQVSLSNSNKTLYLIDAPGSVQTQVRVGYPLDASDRNIASTQDCQLLASWLGRSFSGRLYYDLREIRGLTYGIYGRCFDNPLSRTLKFYGSTKLEHSGAFISGVLDHLTLATQTPASAVEVDALTTYLSSQKMLRQANFHAVEVDAIKQLIRGVSPEQEQQATDRLAALTPEQLQQIAQAVFLNTPYIVIRGDADKISEDINNKLPEWTIVEAVTD